MPRIVIIAGEASGDQLGRGLIESLRAIYPNARFEGVTGNQMRSVGCESWADYEQLAVMGLFEVLRHLPRLIKFKKSIEKRLREDPPDILIGIDAPDFNLRVEKYAKGLGIPTVQYVCPSVWAWRQGRVKNIRAAADLVLCLLPFEAEFVRQHSIAAEFVGHPLADEIAGEGDQSAARVEFGLTEAPVVALLPGSRLGELSRLGKVFLEVAVWLRERVPGVQFINAAASEKTAASFGEQCERAGMQDAVKIVAGRARDVITAADTVLLASGTVTLEAMLLRRPMVVAYRVSPLSAWLVRLSGLIKIKLFSLPNLLAGREIVPEFIQEEAVAPVIGAAILRQLEGGSERAALLTEFDELGRLLRQSASNKSARAIADFLGSRESEIKKSV